MRVLFITSTRIGDAVLSTGALDWALKKWPDARLTIACGPVAAPLFEAVPNLERLIVLRKEAGGGHWRKLWAACVGKWWTAIIDIRRSAMPYLLGAKQRFVMSRSTDTQHKVEAVTAMLHGSNAISPRIWTAASHREKAAALMASGNEKPPILAIAPAANWGGKEWPIDRFIDLGQRLTGENGIMARGALAVLSAPEEAPRADPLIDAFANRHLIDLRGRTDLLTAYACLSVADLFIGNDSALMHLSAAAGIPTLGLFGPGLDQVYGPWGPKSAVVRTTRSFDEIISAPGYDHKSHISRMETLTVDAVEAATNDLWAKHGGSSS